MSLLETLRTETLRRQIILSRHEYSSGGLVVLPSRKLGLCAMLHFNSDVAWTNQRRVAV